VVVVRYTGEPEYQTQNPEKLLAFNLRMRKPLPFTRKF